MCIDGKVASVAHRAWTFRTHSAAYIAARRASGRIGDAHAWRNFFVVARGVGFEGRVTRAGVEGESARTGAEVDLSSCSHSRFVCFDARDDVIRVSE
jgi:hypothetical protein